MARAIRKGGVFLVALVLGVGDSATGATASSCTVLVDDARDVALEKVWSTHRVMREVDPEAYPDADILAVRMGVTADSLVITLQVADTAGPSGSSTHYWVYWSMGPDQYQGSGVRNGLRWRFELERPNTKVTIQGRVLVDERAVELVVPLVSLTRSSTALEYIFAGTTRAVGDALDSGIPLATDDAGNKANGWFDLEARCAAGVPDSTGWCTVLSDPGSDGRFLEQPSATVKPLYPTAGDAIDLRAVSVNLTSDRLFVAVEVTDVDAPLPPIADTRVWQVEFVAGGRVWVLRAYQRSAEMEARLGPGNIGEPAELAIDVEANRVVLSAALDRFRGAFEGTKLSGFKATAGETFEDRAFGWDIRRQFVAVDRSAGVSGAFVLGQRCA